MCLETSRKPETVRNRVSGSSVGVAKFHALNGPAAAGGGADLKPHLQNVESERQDGAKIAKGVIIENKKFLGAFPLDGSKRWLGVSLPE